MKVSDKAGQVITNVVGLVIASAFLFGIVFVAGKGWKAGTKA